MLDEVNDGAVAHHHTLGHAGGAGGEDSVQGVRISGLPADGRKRLLFRASSGRDFKSSRNSISPEKEIPPARSRLSLSAIIRSALRMSESGSDVRPAGLHPGRYKTACPDNAHKCAQGKCIFFCQHGYRSARACFLSQNAADSHRQV